MNETISVEKAITKGQRTVNLPLFFIFLFFIFLPVYLHLEWGFPDMLIFFGFIAGFVFSWLYWSLAVTRWRLWAFRNVRNVHQLQRTAIREKLFWPDNYFFSKTAIWTSAQREEWKQLERKFLVEDVFTDDLSVPKETIVRFSKGNAVAIMVFGIIPIVVALLFFNEKNPVLARFLMGGFGLFMIISQALKLRSKKPLLILNDKGLTMKDGVFYSWGEIEGEEAIIQGYGKQTRHYFVFRHNGNKQQMQMHEFNVNAKKMNKLLYIYRNRFNNNRR